MTFKKRKYQDIVDDILEDLNENSLIKDRNVGSVTRTLVEAFSREVATLYAQMEKTYDSAFIDSAEGAALDYVVSLLGIERIRAGRAVGKVVFSRSTPTQGDITIKQGTIVSDKKKDIRYETTKEVTLYDGEQEIEVGIRASDEDVPIVPKNTIEQMPLPVAGIENVNNPGATVQGTKDESDEALRLRAKTALYGAGKATMEAIEFAVLGEGVNSVVIRERPRGVAGELDIIVDYEGDQEMKEKDVKDAVERTRAAGIRVNFSSTHRINLSMNIKATLTAPLLEKDKTSLRKNIQGSIKVYITSLKAGEKVLNNRIVALAMADSRIQNVQIEIEAGDEKDSVLPNRDVRLDPMEKANITDDQINVEFVLAVPETPSDGVSKKTTGEGTGLPPIQVEVMLSVSLTQDFTERIGDQRLAEDRAREIIETRIRSYFAELFSGDSIDFSVFMDSLDSDKYRIAKAQLRNIHTLDGLIFTLDARGKTDLVRADEKNNPLERLDLVEPFKLDFDPGRPDD